MANIAVTKVDLAVNVMSADLLDAGGAVITDAGANQFVYTPTAGQRIDLVLFKFVADASGDSVVIKAGDQPPSHRAGLGDLTLVLAALDVRYVVVEASRFLQNDGTIIITCSDDGTSALCFELPKIA